MKPWVKILIGVVGGFAGGFAAGFLCHKKMNDVQFEEVSEEEMEEIERIVKEGQEKVSGGSSEEDILKKELPDNPEELRRTLEGKTPYKDADEKTQKAYSGVYEAMKGYSNPENAGNMPTYPASLDDEEDEEPGGPEEDEWEDEDILEGMEMEEVEPGTAFEEPPHPISLAEFYNERPDFDKITLDWYADNTWLDEREEVIADIEAYVGLDAAKLFEKTGPNEDPDVRFVRNDRYGTDYEIIRHHRKWSETVGGY